jgi:hypothetical protein
VLRWGIVALAVLVGVVTWVATSGDDDEPGSGASIGAEPRIVSEAELEQIAADADFSIFWAGPVEGTRLEASEDEAGNVLVRYLAEGSEIGSEDGEAVAIGSYPLEDPAGAVEGFAEREGAIVLEAEDGRELVSNKSAPGSVYFASPDGGVQVEVYAPSAKLARRLARSEDVEPVG